MTPIFRYNASCQILVEQPNAPRCTCHNEGQYMSCTIKCQRTIAEEDEDGSLAATLRLYPVAPGDWKGDVDYVEGKDFFLSDQTAHLIHKPEPLYTRAELLAEVEKAWEAAVNATKQATSIHFATASISFDNDLIEDLEQDHFQNNYGVDISPSQEQN